MIGILHQSASFHIPAQQYEEQSNNYEHQSKKGQEYKRKQSQRQKDVSHRSNTIRAPGSLFGSSDKSKIKNERHAR